MALRSLLPGACIVFLLAAGQAQGGTVEQCRMLASGDAKIVDFKAETATGRKVTLRGLLARPDGAGRFPAVVMLPGSRGPRPPGCYATVVERFLAWGYASLLVVPVPAIGARGVEIHQYDAADLANYGYGAAAALAALPQVDGAQILLWGHSRGGGAVVDRVVGSERAKGQFRAVIAAAPWPGCPDKAPPPAVPLLLQLGANDAVIGVEGCIAYARKLANVEGFEFTLLPEAGHSFLTPGTRNYSDAAATLAERQLGAFMEKYRGVGR